MRVEEVRQGIDGGAIGEVGLLLREVETRLELFLEGLAVVAVNVDIRSEIRGNLRSLAAVELHMQIRGISA